MVVPYTFALTAFREQPSIGPDRSAEETTDSTEVETTDSPEVETTSISEPDGTASVPDTSSGLAQMKCSECEYVTTSRAQYKMHAMKHRPRKWQCAHCSVNFTLLYVLRRALLGFGWQKRVCDRNEI